MPTEPTSAPHDTVPADARRCHDLRTTLTTLRLRAQLLLRDARSRDDLASQRLGAGLAAIDADITTLVRQLDHHDGAANAGPND